MIPINNVSIIGNLTKDVELRYTNNNKQVAEFTIAYNDGYGDNQKAHFFDVVAWEKQAENIAKYCSKGSKVAITGRLTQQTWQNTNGENRSRVMITAINVQFLDSKKESGQAFTTQEVEQYTKKEEDPFSSFGEQIALDDSDLD